MCLQPRLIKNPNYGKPCSFAHYNAWKDCESQYIQVPCGHCEECVQMRQLAYVARSTYQEKVSHAFFVTLTYDNKHLPHNFLNSECFRYKDVQLLLKRFRNHVQDTFGDRKVKYLAAGEYGSKKFRPHYHLLIYVEKDPTHNDVQNFAELLRMEKDFYSWIKDHWAVNIGTDKCPHYVPLFTYHEKWIGNKKYSNYDCKAIRDAYEQKNKYKNSCSSYIVKYVAKTCKELPPSRKYLYKCYQEDVSISTEQFKEEDRHLKSFVRASTGFGVTAEMKEDILECCDRMFMHPDATTQRLRANGGVLLPTTLRNKYADADALQEYLYRVTRKGCIPDSNVMDTAAYAENHENFDNSKYKIFGSDYDLVLEV